MLPILVLAGIPCTPNGRLDAQGAANIRGTSPNAVPNNRMASSSLTMGSSDTEHGYNTIPVGHQIQQA